MITFAMWLKVRLRVSIIAHTLVRAHHILAHAVGADPTGPRALVNVLAGLVVRGQFVACRAVTLEGALRVEATAPAAEARGHGALVNV